MDFIFMRSAPDHGALASQVAAVQADCAAVVHA
jgi:hypothetical protein